MNLNQKIIKPKIGLLELAKSLYLIDLCCICSMASAALLCCLKPYEFSSAWVSAIGSSARKYKACILLSYIVGIESGLLDLCSYPFFGIYTLLVGLALYPLIFKLDASFIFALSVLYNLPSIPAVLDHLELVTLLHAIVNS